MTPDIVAIAKPIAAGSASGWVSCQGGIRLAISAGQHGTTFGGGPLACRVALEYLAIIEDEGLLAKFFARGRVPARNG